MAYFNRSFEKFDQSNLEYLNQGNCAHIAYDHNIIFKQYFSYTELECRLKVWIFEILKDINSPYFIKLIDIYTKKNLMKRIFYRISKKFFIVDAYSAKYYEKEDINILIEPTDYLLDNFRGLESLFEIFSSYAILTGDLHIDNVLFTSQNMIIIDPDFFELYYGNDLKIKNKRKLLSLCRNICKNTLKFRLKNYSEEVIYNFLNELTNFKVDDKTDISYELSKRLKGCKRPIDLITKR